ncbi:TIGR01777 family oxidoreductase [Dietzia sp.]|uniref:TIGR01777 family oxidoreductase n=1 Tax=Dietzia sp. TaxID=1871616 RepID=UPI002FD96F79
MSFSHTCIIDADPERVWGYFSAPGAFHRLAPPFLALRPVSEADSLADGTAVLAPATSLPGPLRGPSRPRWIARHDPSGYIEGERFVDRCSSAPYRRLTGWVHTHTVEAAGPSGSGPDRSASRPPATAVGDHVDARVPARLLTPTFAYRYRQLAADLSVLDRLRTEARDRGGTSLTIAMSGASGLVGAQLGAFLSVAGHTVIRFVRHETSEPGERQWNPDSPAPDLLDGIDVLVHLAGAPIAGRFTAAHVEKVRSSRIGPTRALAELVAARRGATDLVCASAIGLFGAERGDELLDERAAPGEGPIADIVRDWEDACAPAREAGARVVNVRTGIALSGAGGVLGALAPLFAAGLGGRIGDGEQWFSWIALDDLVDIYARAVVDPVLEGALNAVAPNPVRNSEFTETLGRVLHRPALIPVPAAAPALVLGRAGARELALADQRVVPAGLAELGHRFRFRSLGRALAHELGRESLPDSLPDFRSDSSADSPTETGEQGTGARDTGEKRA